VGIKLLGGHAGDPVGQKQDLDFTAHISLLFAFPSSFCFSEQPSLANAVSTHPDE
jgi:hypothetical protein